MKRWMLLVLNILHNLTIIVNYFQ